MRLEKRVSRLFRQLVWLCQCPPSASPRLGSRHPRCVESLRCHRDSGQQTLASITLAYRSEAIAVFHSLSFSFERNGSLDASFVMWLPTLQMIIHQNYLPAFVSLLQDYLHSCTTATAAWSFIHSQDSRRLLTSTLTETKPQHKH